MKFTDEEHEEIARITKTYWKEIIIAILFVAAVFSYWRWNETKKDLAEAVRISTVGRTIEEINSLLGNVTKRETELYPKIDANINDLNTSIKTLNEQVKKLNKPNKDKTNETFKNKNIQDLSKWFKNNGYDNKIVGE